MTGNVSQLRETTDADLVEATSARLVELLTEYAPYRRRWQEHPKAQHLHPGGEIHQGAVCELIAEYLWDSGEVPEDDRDLPRRLKDIVSRALSGKVLAPRTLTNFINAFHISDLHAAELWALRSGGDPARLSIVRPSSSLPERPGSALSFQTISLHDLHVVGADGLPVQHRSVHVIRALDELDRYPYWFDTDAAVVEVLRGGIAGPMYRTPEPGVFGVDIILTRPLSAGETASLEYCTTLHYTTPPPREYRRATRRRVANVEIHVQFSQMLLPTRVCLATWDNLHDTHPATEHEVALEPDGSVHTYLDDLEGIVGFRWDFPRTQ